jgi:hypothetical protein
MDKEEVEKIIEEKISVYKKTTIAFLLGLTLFFGAGIIFPKQFFLPIIENIYPTQYIFEKNKKLISTDPSVISSLFNDNRKKTVLDKLKDHKILGVRLENFPTLSDEIPDEVWKTIEDGDKEKYDLIMNENFTEALKDRFFRDMQRAFATDNPLKYESVEKEIEKYGEIELKANLTTVSSQHQGKATSCNTNFDHNELSVIIVLPRNIDRKKLYRWLACPSSSFPYTELTIRMKNNIKVSQIKVVGVESTGKPGKIELRLSKSTATALELNNAKNYLASGTGKFIVSKATFEW